MKQLFNADLVTLRSLYTNEFNPNDRAKNYYIPLYQREYNWEQKHILKLFDDIVSLSEDTGVFQPYFLGGIVFSRQSMEGEQRTAVSLEVIDGQQRLTTLSIMLASIIQSLKFQKREFPGKEDFVKSLIDDLTSYTITKRFDNDYKVSTVLKVERSDQLKDIYEKLILNLINEKIVYTKYKDLEGEEKTFLNNLRALHRKIKNLEDEDLIHFILQLLDHTQIVVTKTDSFETGYLVFEKLNDSGKGLDAHDLLKNFLFSIKTKEEDTNELKEKWKIFIETIDEITPKISPKLFLEYYLIISGNKYNSSSTSDIFKGYKDYFEQNNGELKNDKLLVLNQMIKIAAKLKELKESYYAEISLNQIDFKLGYLIFLSFYNKFENNYIEYEKKIFNLVFRFGYVYLVTEKIKPIKKIVTEISEEISNNHLNIDTAFLKIENLINNLLIDEKENFRESFSDNNRYKKDHFAKVLFQIINLQNGFNYFNSNIIIERIMPEDISESDYTFEDIDSDNISKYANLIGNLALYDVSKNTLSNDFNTKIIEMSNLEHSIINKILNKDSVIVTSTNKLDELKSYNNKLNWGKEVIIKRSEILTTIAVNLFLNNEMDIDALFYSEIEE